MWDKLKVLARWLLGLGALLSVLLAVSMLVMAVFYGWLRTASGNRWITARVERSLQRAAPQGTVSLGGVKTDLQHHLVIRELHITDAQGQAVVSVGRAQVA